MELLSDAIKSIATASSSDKTCEENAKLELQQCIKDSSYDNTANLFTAAFLRESLKITLL